MAAFPAEAQAEISRLKNEVHAKEETLNQLKLKTKAFVDNMRNELATEKKKVGELEEQLKNAQASHAAPAAAPSSSTEIDALKKEIAAATQRENELKVRAKAFADNMKAQLQTEKEKAQKLEKELHDKTEALANAAANTSHAPALDTHALAEKDAEIASLRGQLQTAQKDLEALADSLQAADARAAMAVAQAQGSSQHEVDALRSDYEHQLSQLQQQLDQAKHQAADAENALARQRSAQGSTEAAFASEHSHLEQEMSKNHELVRQIEQLNRENERLQQEAADRDLQLEQLRGFQQKASESEFTMQQLSGELAVLKQQLRAQTEKSLAECEKCEALKRELSEMSALYEKVNIGRSRSDSQLAEAQSALEALQNVKQDYANAQSRIEEVSRQNMKLGEQLFQKDSEINALKGDLEQRKNDLASLTERMNATKGDSFTRQQQAEALKADKEKAEALAQTLQAKVTELQQKNHELATSADSSSKATTEKMQKAKALLVSLTNEKQTLQDEKNDLQKEVDRLRMELNQRNVENEKRMKQLSEENAQKLQQSTQNVQKLGDEISTLKQALSVLQESEKSQQRAKELANAKREVEESNKKRLAAKAETQKLAVDLENVQKSLNQLSETTCGNSATNMRKIAMLQDRVNEALQLLEKRASASAAASGKKQRVSVGNNDIEVEDIRGPESASREKVMSPSSSTKKAEESIAQLNERLNAIIEVTEKLCDLAMEQHEVNLKDVVIERVSHVFSHCFSEKLRAAYTKVDEATESMLDTSQSSSSSSRAQNRA
ncbi:TPA: hypothetical protein N0F65_007110 [Lagenidium giganteum]|uniref:Uncharacterized protein n=1 Tax=Lagenidium giganteum TaxID=4803 RepID=A0AAV2YR61_9STRA|nr:TPA: hypothetical protein N0F65_007110 [Lagenidium giganteum]